LTLAPEPERLPAFSAAPPTCCLSGSVPAISACAASFASLPAMPGSTQETATNPTRARPAITSNAARIRSLPDCFADEFSMKAARPAGRERSQGQNCVMTVTRHLRISGRVQGVGYRDALCSEALGHGVCGWVRNRRDGTVEAVVQGSAEATDALIAWARKGPPAARVAQVEVTDAVGEQARSYSGFDWLPTA